MFNQFGSFMLICLFFLSEELFFDFFIVKKNISLKFYTLQRQMFNGIFLGLPISIV